MLGKRPKGAMVSPRRAVRALTQRYKFSRFGLSKKPIFLGTAGGAAAGLAAGLATKNFLSASSVSASWIIASMLASTKLISEGFKSGLRLKADLLGRPALAKRFIAKANPKEKKLFLTLANLPFVSAQEIEQQRKRHGVTGKSLEGFKGFRVFSAQETSALREEFKKLANSKNPREITKLTRLLKERLAEKASLLFLAHRQPELTQLVFRTIFSEHGINPETREKAIIICRELAMDPKAKIQMETENEKTGERTIFVFFWHNEKWRAEQTKFYGRQSGN